MPLQKDTQRSYTRPRADLPSRDVVDHVAGSHTAASQRPGTQPAIRTARTALRLYAINNPATPHPTSGISAPGPVHQNPRVETSISGVPEVQFGLQSLLQHNSIGCGDPIAAAYDGADHGQQTDHR